MLQRSRIGLGDLGPATRVASAAALALLFGACGDSAAPPLGVMVGGHDDGGAESGVPEGGGIGGASGSGEDGGGGSAGGAGMDAGADAAGASDAGLVDAGPARLASGNIGPSGGLVIADGISLSFPVGALDALTEITIDEGTLDFTAGLTPMTPMFALGPAEITFARPVTLCLTGDAPPKADEQAIVLHTALGRDAFEALTNCTTQAGSEFTRCCKTTHFSSTGMARGPDCNGQDVLCNDGLCRTNCGSHCMAGKGRCSGACVDLDSTAHCGYCGHDCTGGQACDATDHVCGCPGSAPFDCDGTCTVDRDACLLANPCPVSTPFRCPDASCVASYASCDGACPSATPHECPSGYCVASSAECEYLACPEGKPFLCYDGVSCSALSGAQCPSPTTCPNTAPVRCTPGGTCATALAQCPAGAVCPDNMPVHCDTGPCVSDVGDCAAYPCPEGTPTLCGDGVTCVVLAQDCP